MFNRRCSYSFDNFDTVTSNIMKYGIIALIVLVVLSIVSVIGISLIGGAFPNYSDGERAGTVSKFSHKGLFIKSWEGEMPMGGMVTDGKGNMVANVFKFSVQDSVIVEKVKAALSDGKRVTLHYHQYAIPPVSIETAYVVDGVNVGAAEK